MSTSPLKYILVNPSSSNQLGSGTSPLGAFEVRNWLLNDLCHYADGYGQHIVNWSAINLAIGGTSTGEQYLEPGFVQAPYFPYLLGQWTCPIRIRASANSYRVRMRIGGASSSNGNEVRFFACLGLSGMLSYGPIYDGTGLTLWGPTEAGPIGGNGDAAYRTVVTDSTTPAWLTGESLGPNAWETMIALNPEQVASMLRSHATLTEQSGDDTAVFYLDTTLCVFGMQIDAPAKPRLYAVSACEWVGVDE